MSRQVAFPFLTLSREAVSAEQWALECDGIPVPVRSGYIESWDYHSKLRASRSIDVNLSKAADELGLRLRDTSLELIVALGTGSGSIPRSRTLVYSKDISIISGEISIDFGIDSRQLSTRLRLETIIVLRSPPSARSPISPMLRGSRLWTDLLDLKLEGIEGRFPLEAVSFRRHFHGAIHDGALWHLHWTPGSYERELQGSLRLYINLDHKDLLSRLQSGDRFLVQAMMGDVISQVVEAAIRDIETDELLGEHAEGSIAQQIKTWLELAFPGHSAESIRSIFLTRPGQFRSSIYSISDIGE